MLGSVKQKTSASPPTRSLIIGRVLPVISFTMVSATASTRTRVTYADNPSLTNISNAALFLASKRTSSKAAAEGIKVE